MIALALGLGLCLGAVTGMPLGVVNVAIADAAAAGRVKLAVRIGLGGALADAVHAALAFVGVGRLVTEKPEWTRVMAIVAAVVVAAYVAIAWRRRKRAHEPDRAHDGEYRGVAFGLLLTLPNPAALGAWVAVAAMVWPDVDIVNALALALGVGIGSAVWFAALARWIAAAPRVASVVSRVGLGVLVLIGAVGVARVF